MADPCSTHDSPLLTFLESLMPVYKEVLLIVWLLLVGAAAIWAAQSEEAQG